jgi:hypothetical protein
MLVWQAKGSRMKYRGWTIYAEGAINNWCDFELDTDDDIEMTWLISDGDMQASNIGGFIMLSPEDDDDTGSYQEYAKTLDEARQFIDAWVLRDAADAAVAAWKDPACADLLTADMLATGIGYERLLDTMNSLESALQPPVQYRGFQVVAVPGDWFTILDRHGNRTDDQLHPETIARAKDLIDDLVAERAGL